MVELGLFMLFVPLLAVLVVIIKLYCEISGRIKEMDQQQKDWMHFLETGDDYPWKK